MRLASRVHRPTPRYRIFSSYSQNYDRYSASKQTGIYWCTVQMLLLLLLLAGELLRTLGRGELIEQASVETSGAALHVKRPQAATIGLLF